MDARNIYRDNRMKKDKNTKIKISLSSVCPVIFVNSSL